MRQLKNLNAIPSKPKAQGASPTPTFLGGSLQPSLEPHLPLLPTSSTLLLLISPIDRKVSQDVISNNIDFVCKQEVLPYRGYGNRPTALGVVGKIKKKKDTKKVGPLTCDTE